MAGCPGERNGNDHTAGKNNPLGALEGSLVCLVKERLREILANMQKLMVKRKGINTYAYRRKNNKPKGYNRRTKLSSKKSCPIKRIVNH